MEEELEKIKEIIKKLNEEKELRDISEEEYNEKVCEYFCNAAESSSLSSLLFLSSLLPSQLFLNYRSTKIEDPGEKGWNAILYASKGASIEVMEFLLSFGFDINSLNTCKHNCLFIAIKNGKSKEYIEYLFSKAANFLQITRFNDNLCAILLRDGKYNDYKDVLEILKYLVEERGVDIHFKTKFGETAIQLAASHNVEIMKYFVSLHSDINYQNYRREGVIHCAIKANNMEVIEYLISLNVELDYITDEGFTLFLYAVKFSNLKVIQYLVSLNQFDIYYQLPLNLPNQDIGGCNAIIIGALYNSVEVIQYLVSLGIDFQWTDRAEKNSFFLCAEKIRFSIFLSDQILLNNLFNNMKYLASIGIDTYHNNMNYQQEIIGFIIWSGDIEKIKFIHSLYRECKFDRYSNLIVFSKTQFFYDIKLLKYLTENNIIAESLNIYLSSELNEGSILHLLINSLPKNYLLLKLSPKKLFKRFKECFDYSLRRGNDINNSHTYYHEIPFQSIKFGHFSEYVSKELSWMLLKYLIDKGSNLFHISINGSILRTNFCYFTLPKMGKGREAIMKYIIIRSVEINEKSSAHVSMIQYIIQHSKIQNNNNKDSLLIYNNTDYEIEMKEEWKRVFSSFVLSPPLILSIEKEEKLEIIVNDNGELNIAQLKKFHFQLIRQ